MDYILRNIKRARAAKGLTQKDMSNRLKISEVQYSKIESGKVGLSYDKITALAKIFGIRAEQLIQEPDAPVVTIANQKGGVCKTTLVILFATMFAHQRKDKKVCIIDADYQQSVVKRESEEKREGKKTIVKVIPFLATQSTSPILDLKLLVEQCQKEFDLVLVDTIGSISDTEMISTTMSLSDVVLVPIQPTPLAVQSSIGTIGLLPSVQERRAKQNLPFIAKGVIVLAKNNLESKELQALKTLQGLELMKPILKDKTAYIRDLSLVDPVMDKDFLDVYFAIEQLLDVS